MICHKERLVISISLHALNYRCTENMHLSVAKSPKMATSISNENPGQSLERIEHQIKNLARNFQVF